MLLYLVHAEEYALESLPAKYDEQALGDRACSVCLTGWVDSKLIADGGKWVKFVLSVSYNRITLGEIFKWHTIIFKHRHGEPFGAETASD